MYRFPSVPANSLLIVLALLSAGCTQDTSDKADKTIENNIASKNDPLAGYVDNRTGYYGYGSPATTEQITGWDIDVRPDGMGLPEGSGSVEDGETLYEDKCAECHGTFGEGEGRYPVLAGGQGSLKDARPTKTVGSYWPYTSTLFDYIHRAMPFTQPESLSANETYAVTAYVLYLNDLVEDDFVLNRDNLASVHLPNEGNFVADPRPDVANERCMENCRDPGEIKIVSEVSPSAAEQTSVQEGSASPGSAADSAGNAAQKHPGEGTYQQYCSICHAVGVGGAPKLGDVTTWAARIEKGIDTLIANAVNGVTSNTGVMPAKGGFAQLSDDEVAAAVRYMVEVSQ